MKRILAALLPAALFLSGCDQVNQRLGLEDPAKKEARQDGEGRAVGSACRQSGRAIEDCYAIYYWLPKASVFAGWREMNDYMLTNKLEIVQPRFEPPGSPEEMRKKRQKSNGDDEAATKSDETKAAAGGAAKSAAGDEAKPADKAAGSAESSSQEKPAAPAKGQAKS